MQGVIQRLLKKTVRKNEKIDIKKREQERLFALFFAKKSFK